MAQTTFSAYAHPIAEALDPETNTQFKECFNKKPFLIHHQLINCPLFEPSSLYDLALRLSKLPGHLYYDTGDIEVHQKWGSIPIEKSLEEAMDQLPTRDTWIILKSAHVDPAYQDLLAHCLDDVGTALGRNFRNEIKNPILSIILTSPHRVTPYHMDGECNFLLQIQGKKTIYVFDGTDRSIVTETELEQLWMGNRVAAEFKDSAQAKAQPFELMPGIGVHVPLTFPHWVKNGDAMSISASINFEFVDTTLPDLYRMNYHLRRLGLHPRPPGQTPTIDHVKVGLFHMMSAVRSKRKPHK